LHHETRIVDKAGCISFRGRKYETSLSLIGAEVEIAYDPMSTETLTVSYLGIPSFTTRPLQIGEYCAQKPAISVSMLPVEPESFRFLAALQRKHEETKQHNAHASPLRHSGKRHRAMYNASFDMKNTPFVRNIPVNALYEPQFMTETLRRLGHAAEHRLFCVVISDSGTGKSTLIRKFVENLPQKDYFPIYLSDSKLTPRWLYK